MTFCPLLQFINPAAIPNLIRYAYRSVSRCKLLAGSGYGMWSLEAVRVKCIWMPGFRDPSMKTQQRLTQHAGGCG